MCGDLFGCGEVRMFTGDVTQVGASVRMRSGFPVGFDHRSAGWNSRPCVVRTVSCVVRTRSFGKRQHISPRPMLRPPNRDDDRVRGQTPRSLWGRADLRGTADPRLPITSANAESATAIELGSKIGSWPQIMSRKHPNDIMIGREQTTRKDPWHPAPLPRRIPSI